MPKQDRQVRISSWIAQAGDQAKLAGPVFKKRGWRKASLLAFWGHRQPEPLFLVSSLPPQWCLIGLYRRRYLMKALCGKIHFVLLRGPGEPFSKADVQLTDVYDILHAIGATVDLKFCI